jgi:hypothetical protein
MINLLKNNLNVLRKEMSFSINWPYLISFLIFWSYGYQAAGNYPLIPQTVFTIFITFLLGVFLYFGEFKKNKLTSTHSIAFFDLSFLAVITFLFLTINFSSLNNPLVGDQLFYSLMAKRHEIFGILKITELFELNDFSFSKLIYIADIVALLILIFLFFLIYYLKLNFLIRTLLLLIIFILTRCILLHEGGGYNLHPAFQLFPIWLSTSLFGISDFSFRISQFIGLICATFFIFINLSEKIGRLNALLTALALTSIPILFHVASLVEGSIWTSILLSLFLIRFLNIDKESFLFWFAVSSIITTFVMMRITALIVLPTFLMIYFFSNFKYFKINTKEYIYALLPFLVCLPIVLKGILYGTPATYHAGESPFIPYDNSTYHRIVFALINNIPWETAVSNIGYFWLSFLFFIFIKNKRDSSYFFNRLSVISLFCIGLLIFFSIRPVLWGVGRYKAEYLIPFIIFGGYMFFTWLNSSIFKKALPLIAFLLISYNVFHLNNFPTYIPDIVSNKKFSRETEEIYDYNSALIEAKREGLASYTLIAGVTNGVMPQILAGYSVKEIKDTIKILDNNLTNSDWTSFNADLINSASEIKLVLISDGNNSSLKSDLQKLGWMDWKNFRAKGTDNIIYGLVRNI